MRIIIVHDYEGRYYGITKSLFSLYRKYLDSSGWHFDDDLYQEFLQKFKPFIIYGDEKTN
jgi:hypothetical protein